MFIAPLRHQWRPEVVPVPLPSEILPPEFSYRGKRARIRALPFALHARCETGPACLALLLQRPPGARWPSRGSPLPSGAVSRAAFRPARTLRLLSAPQPHPACWVDVSAFSEETILLASLP